MFLLRYNQSSCNIYNEEILVLVHDSHENTYKNCENSTNFVKIGNKINKTCLSSRPIEMFILFMLILLKVVQNYT